MRLSLIGTLLLCSIPTKLHADEKLKGIACRSVHLAYSGPEATLFYNEVKVERSAEGTYFCVCGFSKGYYGIQELGNGKKLVIFSVWDPGNQQHPKNVLEERRVKLLYNDPKVRVGRFGNEGTGGQSFFDYDWKIGQTYAFVVTATREGTDRTAYASYFLEPETKKWRHLVTFSTLTKGELLKGYYSFVEDFRRNKISTTKNRRAQFNNAWIKTMAKGWQPLDEARFTADTNPVLNINAGVINNQFFLSTGGDIKNTDTPLRQKMKRKAGDPPSISEKWASDSGKR